MLCVVVLSVAFFIVKLGVIMKMLNVVVLSVVLVIVVAPKNSVLVSFLQPRSQILVFMKSVLRRQTL